MPVGLPKQILGLKLIIVRPYISQVPALIIISFYALSLHCVYSQYGRLTAENVIAY